MDVFFERRREQQQRRTGKEEGVRARPASREKTTDDDVRGRESPKLSTRKRFGYRDEEDANNEIRERTRRTSEPVDRGRSTGAVIGGGDARIRRRKPRTVFAHLGHVLYRDGRRVHQTGCDYLNIHPDLFAQIFVFNPDMATIWSIPLLLSLAVVLLVDEKVEFVKELKEIMVDGVIPNIGRRPAANGILMLSLGAGIERRSIV